MENFFGKKLRAAREKAGLTQEEAAEAIGSIRTNYYPYETGRRLPALKYREPLSSALSIPIEKLNAWIAISEFGPEVIKTAYKELRNT